MIRDSWTAFVIICQEIIAKEYSFSFFYENQGIQFQSNVEKLPTLFSVSWGRKL